MTRPKWYEYKGKRVKAYNKEDANRKLGSPCAKHDVTPIKYIGKVLNHG